MSECECEFIKVYSCAICHKTQNQVNLIINCGVATSICNECIDLLYETKEAWRKERESNTRK